MADKLCGDEALTILRRLAEAPRSADRSVRQPPTAAGALAAAAGKPMLVAVFTVEGGQLRLSRYTREFPNADMPRAVALLRADLEREAPWEFDDAECRMTKRDGRRSKE